MHVLQRVVHPLRAPARQGRRAVDDLARLRRHADGGGRPPGRGGARADDHEVQGQLHPRRRGQSAARRRRHLLHSRRQAVRREAAPRRQGREGDRLVGLLRVVGLRAGREAEPDAGDAGPQGHHRQADHQGARLSADRRGDDRRRHLHPDVRPAARSRRAGPAEDVLQPARARQVLSPAALRRGSVRRALRRRRRADGLLPLQGRLQGSGHLQRLLGDALERGAVVPDPVGPRLHRLLRGRVLGQGLLLRPPDDDQGAGRRSASRARRTGSVSPPSPPPAPRSPRTPRSARSSRRAARTATTSCPKWRNDHGDPADPRLHARQQRQAHRRRPDHADRGPSAHRGQRRQGQRDPQRGVHRNDVARPRGHPQGPRPARRVGVRRADLRRVHRRARAGVGARRSRTRWRSRSRRTRTSSAT